MPEFLPFSYFFSSSWSMRDKLVHKHLDFFPAVPVIMVPFTTNSSAIVDKFGIRMSWCPGCGELSSQVGVGTVFVPPSTWFAYSAMWAWFILVLVPGRRWVNMFCIYELWILLCGELHPIVMFHGVPNIGEGIVELSHCQPVTIFWWTNLDQKYINPS